MDGNTVDYESFTDGQNIFIYNKVFKLNTLRTYVECNEKRFIQYKFYYDEFLRKNQSMILIGVYANKVKYNIKLCPCTYLIIDRVKYTDNEKYYTGI